jgi:hypothetical protein
MLSNWDSGSSCAPYGAFWDERLDFEDEADEYPIYRPSEEEFGLGFRRFVTDVVLQDPRFEACGICKVRARMVGWCGRERGREGVVGAQIESPASWRARYTREYYDERLGQLRVRPVEQVPVGSRGAYQLALEDKPVVPWGEFAARGNAADLRPRWTVGDSLKTVEREYWARMGTCRPAQYGSDMLGSLFFPDDAWNLDRLDSDLRRLSRRIPGINQSMLYAGMWRAVRFFLGGGFFAALLLLLLLGLACGGRDHRPLHCCLCADVCVARGGREPLFHQLPALRGSEAVVVCEPAGEGAV